MSESTMNEAILLRLNSFLPRQARWAYFQDGSGPMFIWNTERLHTADRNDVAFGKFESGVAMPTGRGSRTGRATEWRVDPDSRSLHTLRKDAKTRAFRLYTEWQRTGKVTL